MLWNDEQEHLIALELIEIELIAESLQREIGNETTLELVDRLKLLKKALGENDWEKVAKK